MEKTNSTLASKVIYRATILSACTMWETAGDYIAQWSKIITGASLSTWLNLWYGASSIILLGLLVFALARDAKSKEPHEGRYWLTIVIMSTTGTAFADFLTRSLKLWYTWWTLVLMVMFIAIYLAEKRYMLNKSSLKTDIDIETQSGIDKDILPKTDAFYRWAILIASTFGTTMWDFTSDVLWLWFAWWSVFLFTLLCIALFLEFRTKTVVKPIYRAALIISSTIWATTWDRLTKPAALNLWYGIWSAILIWAFVIIFLIRMYIKNNTLAKSS